jgi:hypothetical protein
MPLFSGFIMSISQSRLAIFLVIVSSSSYAVDSGISPLGFSGALSTPMAHTLNTGQAAVAFTPYLDGQGINVDGYNYLLGIGLVRGTEVFGRLATNTVAEHCAQEDCGLRDLSASIKIKVPELSLLFDQKQPKQFKWIPHLAVGATDLGGQTSDFRSYYGVSTWDNSQWALSLGWAHAVPNGVRQSRLDGAFASLVVQPLPWLQGLAEYDGQDAQVGMRLITPPSSKWSSQVKIQAEVRSGVSASPPQERDIWWGLSARFPLDIRKVHPTKSVDPVLSASVTPPSIGAPIENGRSPATAIADAPTSINHSHLMSQARELADRLEAQGFENIRVGYTDQRWIVAVENQTYAQNVLDALGVALGEFATWSGAKGQQLTLMLEHQEQLVLSLDTDQQCIDAWLNRQQICPTGLFRISEMNTKQGWQYHQPWEDDHRPWLIRHQAPIQYQPRVTLAPVLNYALGTEYGSLDYSLGLSTTLEMPLFWAGLVADVRYISRLDQSKDYQQGGVFASSDLEQGIDRMMLHQYWQHSKKISTHWAVGRIYSDYDGFLTEGLWNSDHEIHQFGVLAGAFSSKTSNFKNSPLIVSYRYQVPLHSDIQIGLKAGEFFDGDRGYFIDSRFAYGDTFVSLFYQSSQHPSNQNTQQYAGIQFSLPLGQRQSLPMHYGRIGGTTEYNQAIKTEVNNTVNRVIGTQQYARLHTAPQSLNVKLYNRDRISQQYLHQNLDRIHEAYQKYVLIKSNL